MMRKMFTLNFSTTYAAGTVKYLLTIIFLMNFKNILIQPIKHDK